jgi:hypothetical protein
LALQVTLFLTASKERKRGGGRYRPPLFVWIFWQRRVGSHATNGGVHRDDAPPLFLQFQKASSTIPGFLGICVVIFTCLNMYLNYCYIFFFLKFMLCCKHE